MKQRKIVTTFIVAAIILSTIIQLNMVTGASAATPGVNEWGDATMNLEYGVSYASVYINSSAWAGTPPFYLYYPTYRSGGTGGNANTFTWDGPYKVSGYNVRVTSKANSALLDTGGVPIAFNRSGMYIFDADSSHSGNNPNTYAGFLWVNTSTKYTIDPVADFSYGSTGSLNIYVNTGNDTGCMIAIVNPNNNTIYHKWRASGVSEAIGKKGNFTLAGTYMAKGYRDFDQQNFTYYYPDEFYTAGGITENYSQFYGSDYTGHFPAHPSTTPEYYNYTNVGPWDPPEKNATEITFTVATGKPTITLTNTSIYWGFEARIDVNVTDSQGEGIDVANPIQLKFGSTYVDFSAYITNLGQGNYCIEIPRWDAGNGWTDLATAVGSNVNGTWKVVFGYDANGDGTYEWNNTASFIVKGVTPPIQVVIVDDGSGAPTDKKVNVPAYDPGTGYASTIDMSFDIFGTSVLNDMGRAYYGDDPWEDYKNITVSGDILYPTNAMTLVHSGTEGRWDAIVTPTKPGGTITITIDWPGALNGTATQTIQIINGTFVIPAVDLFTVGADFNLTVTIDDMDGAPVKTAAVYLMWQDVSYEFNFTIGTNTPGNGQNGQYTFWIPPHSKQPTTPETAPQNITVAAEWFMGHWGYAKVIMDKDHNMLVNITPTTSYAGESTEYDISVALAGGGHPDTNGLVVALYDSTGALVTGEDAWSKTGHYLITNEEIILSGGSFQLYAHNDTHDSRGHNATLLINKFIVTSYPPVLAWRVDTNVNMTFQLTPPRNGTLQLNNMSSLPNASDPGQSTQISIYFGEGVLDDVNATTLGNVTYDYIPDGGAERSAEGLLQVRLPTVTPSPHTVHVGEVSPVMVTVTHPATGSPLEGINVTLEIPGIYGGYSEVTDITGQVTFTFVPVISGEITILIDNYPSETTIHIVSNESNIPPSAAFSWTADDLLVTFTDESYDPDGFITSWQWDFGNGYESSLQNPMIAYSIKGNYVVTLLATDNDNATDAVSQIVTVGPPPVANFTFIPMNPTTFTIVHFTDTSTDNLGVIISWWWDFGDQYYASLQNPEHCYTAEGVYTVTLTVTDNYGLTNSTQKTITVNNVDTTPPQTNISFQGTVGDNRWYVSPVLVALTATDNQSGVASTFYSIDDGTWTTYTAPFLISYDGNHTISYYSIDTVGNAETPKTAMLKIDQVPPMTYHTYHNHTLTIYAYDATSGVNHTYFKLHAADPWTEYSPPVTISTDGSYELYYYSVDKAGNVEMVKGPFVIMVDDTAPTITLTATPENLMKTKWLLNATVYDATSGVNRVEFYVDNQLQGTVTSAPYEWDYEGSGKVAYAIAYDNAGNSQSSPIVTCQVLHLQSGSDVMYPDSTLSLTYAKVCPGFFMKK